MRKMIKAEVRVEHFLPLPSTIEQSCSPLTLGYQLVDYKEYIMLTCERRLLNLGYKFKTPKYENARP